MNGQPYVSPYGQTVRVATCIGPSGLASALTDISKEAPISYFQFMPIGQATPEQARIALAAPNAQGGVEARLPTVPVFLLIVILDLDAEAEETGPPQGPKIVAPPH